MIELVVCNACGAEFKALEIFREHWKEKHLINYSWFLYHPLIISHPNQLSQGELRETIDRWKRGNHYPYEQDFAVCDERREMEVNV